MPSSLVTRIRGTRPSLPTALEGPGGPPTGGWRRRGWHAGRVATFITSMAIGAGLRLAIKDLIDLEGVPTTAGCRAVADAASAAASDAVCLAEVRRLVERRRVQVV